ncbi:cAMP-dependent protein kinase inhibitor beta [Protopterus annectens]|uniref:cAMP-dependent protein kinase inhibitor beta n=1 Tax=Protopterus annectens TaxID=7888 RepID=UPI001CFB3659|nr:cAMP-dependent protein kinase inhibitor beta [Protopterus annectens]XP_043929725.1 cAMP-dependent protein kinase inhibitor beta [Protopterus annectens]XP_043929733.1 cAMP-dependent protein kinase inhibitor beta [Protopterus annectens]XP_043929742.1 cAMP-dependent protein kinase inhibitor beta [Protopterus annectens]XP_043929753.1 cAMP-dependent protein kinase inhibitor beta [Protopterus annectens]XP_043929762.1 cAMP-dependent protein kinase inhibitor beta [Protopterus annectens]
MTDVEPVVTDFASTGRTGRRNALPDILGSPAGAGTSELPHKFSELSVTAGAGAEDENTALPDVPTEEKGAEEK